MIQPTDFLNSAHAISEHGQSEMDISTGVNRAYYAAFHAANDVVNHMGLPAAPTTVTGGSHEKTFARLIACTPSFAGSADRMRKAQSIGYVARKVLKPNRVHADYNLTSTVVKTVLDDTYEKASKIVAESIALINTP